MFTVYILVYTGEYAAGPSVHTTGNYDTLSVPCPWLGTGTWYQYCYQEDSVQYQGTTVVQPNSQYINHTTWYLVPWYQGTGNYDCSSPTPQTG